MHNLRVTRELAKYSVDIAALSEVHFEGESSLEEVGAGYTFYYISKPPEE